MLEKYPEEVNIVFKNFPLRNHKQALPAARAAMAAHEQGRFWDYHDKLFNSPQGLGEQRYLEIAGELGLDLQRFEKDQKQQDIHARVIDDYRLGQSVEVRGTPAVYVNGRAVDKLAPEVLDVMIRQELGKR